MPATRTRPGLHLVAVTLRARSRKQTIPARLSRVLSEVRALGRRVGSGPPTTVELDLLVRRRLLGEAAYRLAVAVEAALEAVDAPELEEHLDALNSVGVDHHASAQDLACEAAVLIVHAQDLTRLAGRCRRIAAALDAQLAKSPG